MMDKERNIISEQTHNVLAELGNIGAGNAATSLSVMLSSKIIMSPPQVVLKDFNELEEALGGADATVVGVLSNMEGEIQTMILFVVGMEDAKKLVEALISENMDWYSEMGTSAINEVANIIIGSYVASLETLLGHKIRYSPPQICIDMAGAILNVASIHVGRVSDKALMINSSFKVEGKEINGYIMVISDADSFNLILEQMGIGGVSE